MNRKKEVIFVLPVFVLLSVYLYYFWYGRLMYYQIYETVLALLLAGTSIFLAIYRPIPIKIRSICILYIIVFGLAAEILNVFCNTSIWNIMYGSGLFVVICMTVALCWGYLNGKHIKRTSYQVVLNRKISKNLRIALLSDIHMGLCVDRKKLSDVCQKIEAEKPDLLLLAGDICDDQTKYEDMLFVIEQLGKIKTACGTYCVLGNHDLGAHGPALQYTEQDLRRAMFDGKIHVLDDERVETEAFIIIGRRDSWFSEVHGGRVPVLELFPREQTDCPVLILDHQPYDAKEAADCGADLQFSGHTHAGQIWPISWFGRFSPTFYGFHYIKTMGLIVSSGLGGRGNRLRSGCSAEYVMVEVKGSRE